MDSLDMHVLNEAWPKLVLLVSTGFTVLFILAVVKLYEIAKHLKDIKDKLSDKEQKDNNIL